MPTPFAPPDPFAGRHIPTLLGPPVPPFAPASFAMLLLEQPARAAAVLAAMRPQQRAAQVRAHAGFTRFMPHVVEAAWNALIARHGLPRPAPLTDEPCIASLYDPELLADAIHDNPTRAVSLLAQLSDTQRVAQATAHAAWLNTFDYPVTTDEVFEWWAALCAPVES